MAISTGAAILGGSVISGVLGASASRSAGRTQARSADAATAEQKRQYDLGREDLAPYRQIGGQALNQLGSLYGFSPHSSPAPQQQSQASPGRFRNVMGMMIPSDLGTNWMSGGQFGEPSPQQSPQNGMAQPNGMAGFFASPDYQFRRDEGMRGIEQGAAARGGALSGNALRALTGYSSNLAAGEYGNYYNRLASLAGVGQAATNQGVAAGQNYANMAGQSMMASGAARASGTMGAANSWGNAINSGLNLWGMSRGWGTTPTGGSRT